MVLAHTDWEFDQVYDSMQASDRLVFVHHKGSYRFALAALFQLQQESR